MPAAGGHAPAEAQPLTGCFSAVASPLTTRWTGHVASAGQRKPSPPAPGRARPAGRLQRDVRAEGKQSRDQGTWHQSWGQGHGQPAAGTSVVLSAEWTQAHRTQPRPSLPLPRWAASLPGGLGLPAWTGQDVSCCGLPTPRFQPRGRPRGTGRPRLGTTAPWWTGRGWHHPAAHPQAGRGRPRLGWGGQGPCTCLPGEGLVCTRPPAPYRVPAADDAQPAVLGGGGRGRLWGQNREAGRGRPLPGAPAPPAQPREALLGLEEPPPISAAVRAGGEPFGGSPARGRPQRLTLSRHH